MNSENLVPKSWNVAKKWRENRKGWVEVMRLRQYRYNPKINAISREAYKLAGGQKIFYDKTEDERLRLRRIAEENISAKTIPAKETEVFPDPIITESEVKAEKVECEIEYQPQGWVYIMEDRLKIPGVVKIGKTSNLKKRIATARTWGDFVYLSYHYFGNCKVAEGLVHNDLSDHRVYRDNLGDEWFEVSHEEALKSIEKKRWH